MITIHGRTADHPIEPMFLERWSPRTFTGEPIADADLFTILEAARWAPSSSNLQPWRFLYAKRDSAHWPTFFEALSPGNRGWVGETSVLLAIVSKRTRQPTEGPPVENYSHSFDTGTAWGYLALQASRMGWAAHAMTGFDKARAVANLGIPDDYRIECMAAIGRFRADPEASPAKGRFGRDARSHHRARASCVRHVICSEMSATLQDHSAMRASRPEPAGLPLFGQTGLTNIASRAHIGWPG